MAERADDERIEVALADVWTRTRPLILERVAAIERAGAELSKEEPDIACIDAGRTEAHKLAGVLGTFGLARGTDLARALELRLEPDVSATEAEELGGLAAQLRALVEGTP